MSRIAISGNVSGTGVFTLASPATNTDRTLTLPDATGTIITTGSSELTPAGTVIFYASDTAPTGYLKANGALISRTTYAALFAAIGTTFGVGDGSTTFGLPDLRGEFPRGWDDSRGADSGRAFGSAQSHALENITGYFGITPVASFVLPTSSLFTASRDASLYTALETSTNASEGDEYNKISFDASNVVNTSTETRPRNIALLACIKY